MKVLGALILAQVGIGLGCDVIRGIGNNTIPSLLWQLVLHNLLLNSPLVEVMGRIPGFLDAHLHIKFTSKLRGMSYQKGTLETEQACPTKGCGWGDSPLVSKHGDLFELCCGSSSGCGTFSSSGSLGCISK